MKKKIVAGIIGALLVVGLLASPLSNYLKSEPVQAIVPVDAFQNINEAIDSLPSIGGVVELSSGIYYLSI